MLWYGMVWYGMRMLCYVMICIVLQFSVMVACGTLYVVMCGCVFVVYCCCCCCVVVFDVLLLIVFGWCCWCGVCYCDVFCWFDVRLI